MIYLESFSSRLSKRNFFFLFLLFLIIINNSLIHPFIVARL